VTGPTIAVVPRFLRARSPRALIAIAACAAVAVAGCSVSQWDTSDSNGPSVTAPKTYTRDTEGVRQSLIDHLSTVGDNLNQWAAPRDQATCAADRIIERVGVDRLLALGYDPDVGKLALPYAPDEQTAMLNILTHCIDFREGLLELLSAYQKLSFKSASCVADGLDRLGLTRLYVASLLTGTEPDPFDPTNNLSQSTTRIMGDCIPADELTPALPSEVFPQDYDQTTTTSTPPPTTPSTTELGSVGFGSATTQP
jgi:hypothetical protein